MTTIIEKRIETLIAHEIYLNQNALVEDLILKPNPDMIECIENFYDESSATVEEFLSYETGLPESDWEDLDVHDRLNLAEAQGFESQPHEIYEWWLVSDWLADKLKEFEEPVLDCNYGSWWGRTCTGQAIKLDYVVRKIVETTGYAEC